MKETIKIIKKTVEVLDSVTYENYSDGEAKTYIEYINGERRDEDKLISPLLLRKFLEDVLGFKLGESIYTKEKKKGGKPDYIPIDIRTHPFVFDAKGTDTRELSKHFSQIKRYIVSEGLKYGVLTNMRDLEVYTCQGRKEENYSFSFVELYRDYKYDSLSCLKKSNTKKFLNFVQTFSYRPLTREEKIERIAKAKPWTGKEEIDVNSLNSKLKYIVTTLSNDAKNQKNHLIELAEMGGVNPQSIAYEIEEIAAQIEGREKRKVNDETFMEIMNTDEKSPYGRAREAFFRRVAYFAMTRLLLARVWEDIGFTDQTLYDGGFAKWYENFNREIKRVLNYAFNLSAERYPWLFKAENNYSWYNPSDDALIDSLYELSNFYLGKLDQDILGTIYEEYIEKVDKKNKGQYYTPREIVSFIWDRVGFNNPKAFFWHIEGKRRPKLIYDLATGSGGFLVEAARRIRDRSHFDWNEPDDLKDIHDAILWGIFGSEISPFPYYLTQVNLLIQLTPVIKRYIELTGKKPREQPTPLGIICEDSLSLHNPGPELLPIDNRQVKENNTHKILHFTKAEERIYEKIKKELAGKFYYCCANPPYVGEKGHKELFRYTLKTYPYWKKYYQGKMDYLYWFIILGLSKLREYGKLGFITTAYWPTADGASKLRKYILENVKIKEMVFFGDVKIFEHAKGQHSMVFILTKCSGKDKKEERENNHIKIVQVKCRNQDLPGDTIRENLDFLVKHIEKYIDKSKYEDNFIKVFWSGVKQGELSQDGEPWNEIFTTREDKDFTRKIEFQGEHLENICTIIQGIVSGADTVTQNNIKLIPEYKISEYDIKKGKGIFVLPDEELKKLRLSQRELSLIHKTYKNSDITPYFVDLTTSSPLYIIYTTKQTNINDFPNIKRHLEKFKEILENKRECREGKLPWYSLHWARDKKILSSFKIVTPRWGEEIKPFGLQTGDFYENSDINLIVPKENTKEDILYILGVLNSSLIINWMIKKAQQKGLTRQSILFKIPVHRIDFDNPKEVKYHDKIVENVKLIRENMTKLAKYSKFFKERLTKLDFDAPLPDMNTEEIIKSLPPEKIYSLRTHPDIKIIKPGDFNENGFYISKIIISKQPTLNGNFSLELKGKNKKSVFIEGDFDLLDLIADVLTNKKGKSWKEIKETLIPESMTIFNKHKTKIINNVQNIRSTISQLQNEINQIVYRLYGLSNSEIKIIEGKE